MSKHPAHRASATRWPLAVLAAVMIGAALAVLAAVIVAHMLGVTA